MKPVHKFVWALMVSLALLLSGCGGSSGSGDSAGALSAEEQAKMARAKTQMDALKMAYDAAVAALVTLEDDFSDATQAEIDDVEAKLTALKAADTAAVDVSAGDKAMYSVQEIETRLASGKKSARLALAAEVADKAKMERAETQVAALKMAYEAAVAALETLEDDFSDATQAEIDDAQAKLDALKTKVTEAVDVSAEDKAKYSAQTIETRLAGGKKSARLALEDEKEKMAEVENQAAALKTAYDAAVAAVAALDDDVTQAEIDDAQKKLDTLKTKVTEAVDVSAEVKAMYPTDQIEADLELSKATASFNTEVEGFKTSAETAIGGARTAIDGAKTAIDGEDGAKAVIDGAETAVDNSGIIRIQTIASQDVETAKTAYETALTAYETALTAYETALTTYETAQGRYDAMDPDEADDIEKANALKAAADNAKTAADDAKTKADDAKTKADDAKTKADEYISTASMTALRYVEGAYRVGDMSINPTDIGESTVTVTKDGTTMTTGYIKSIDSMSEVVEGRDYVAAAGSTPAKPGQVKIWPRTIMVGSVYDSADDEVRLRLINHYSGKESVYGYRPTIVAGQPGATKHSAQGFTAKSSEGAPYGKTTMSGHGKVVPVKKVTVTAKFYRTYGKGTDVVTENPLATSTGGYDIGSNNAVLNAKGAYTGAGINGASIIPTVGPNREIYYYEADDGTRYYFRIASTSSTTDSSTGKTTITYTYTPEEVTKIENFPAAQAYQYMNYGIWAMLDRDSPAELGIGFVRRLTENSITSDLPSGKATYNGHWVANIRAADTGGEGAITEHDGEAVVMAKFTDRKVEVDLKTLAKLEGTITSGTSGFKGTKVTNVLALDGSGLTASVNTGDTPDFTATMSGAFFGPMAAEVGGIFNVMSEGMKKGEFRGAFGGVKQPAEESSE